MFPNIQFIITTHSPQVLGEVDDNFNILSFEREKNGINIAKISSLVGWDTNYILSEFMNTEVVNQSTGVLISNMYEYISEKKFDEAEKLMKKLEILTNSAHEDVVKAQILIARGRK